MYHLMRGEKELAQFPTRADAEWEATVLAAVHPGLKYRVVSAASMAVEECLRLLAAPSTALVREILADLKKEDHNVAP